MSFLAVDNAAKLTGITSTEKLVLMILCTFHNGDKKSPRFNQCNPSHQTIADRSGLGKSTVSTALRGLKEKGLITYETVKIGGIFTSSNYDVSKLYVSAPDIGMSAPDIGGMSAPDTKACNAFEAVSETVNEAVLKKEHCAKNAQSTDAIAPAPTPKQPKQKTVKPEKPKPFYETIELPEFIDREMWLGWQRERKDKFKSKAAYTEFAINQHLSQLTDLHNEGFNANAALVLIRGSVWQGVNKNVCMEKLQKQKSPAIATYDEQGLQVISINSGTNYDTPRQFRQPASATAQIDAGNRFFQHRYETTGQGFELTEDF